MDKLYFDDLTRITAPFGMLDYDTQARLQEAAKNGARVQYFEGEEWIWWTPHWVPACVYRVDPDWTPAPIPMSFDWSVLSPDWVWAAVDSNDRAFAYRSKPREQAGAWWCSERGGMHRIDGLASFRRGTVDFRDSLIRRLEGV